MRRTRCREATDAAYRREICWFEDLRSVAEGERVAIDFMNTNWYPGKRPFPSEFIGFIGCRDPRHIETKLIEKEHTPAVRPGEG